MLRRLPHGIPDKQVLVQKLETSVRSGLYFPSRATNRRPYRTQVIKLKNIPPKEQEACRNEVELLRRMCHPNIVGYTNSFLYKNCLCIIMEYCDAGDLGDRVNEAKVRASRNRSRFWRQKKTKTKYEKQEKIPRPELSFLLLCLLHVQ